MSDDELKRRTKETARRLFTGPVEVDVPYALWKAFDPQLAKDLSLFITGKLYAREVLLLPERQVVATAALVALDKPEELKVHLHGALNVGVAPRKLAETIFQVGVYAGFPCVNRGLQALRQVLEERGQWPPASDQDARKAQPLGGSS